MNGATLHKSVILSRAKDLLFVQSGMATLAILIAFAPPTNAQTAPPTCQAPPSTHAYILLRHLPQPVQQAVSNKVKDIVDSDRPFDAPT